MLKIKHQIQIKVKLTLEDGYFVKSATLNWEDEHYDY